MNTIELRYTLGGDLNLAGTVVFADFALVVANYGKPESWDGGAITYVVVWLALGGLRHTRLWGRVLGPLARSIPADREEHPK